MGGRLLVFNPEHDYALANGSWHYTIPLQIRKIAKDLQYLPLIWSKENDFLLLEDNSIVSLSDNKTVKASEHDLQGIEPWGWNLLLYKRLSDIGVDSSKLLSPEKIDIVRRLSHRRISIDCNSFLNSRQQPIEFDNVDDAVSFFCCYHNCYFKMPWSSGGRGVLATRELNSSQVREWVTGCIKKQGSVIGEMGIHKILDFSSLWNLEHGEVNFVGYSIFRSDGRGKYKGNYYGSQEEIYHLINTFTKENCNDIINRQRDFLLGRIAPYFNGPLGIDMMVDNNGIIYPCVEINLRRTMGHIAIEYYKKTSNNESRNYWQRECRFASVLSLQEFRC